jgi:hypothetical protein
MDRSIRAGVHGAEFEESEPLAEESDPLLPEQQGTAGSGLDNKCCEQHEWQQQRDYHEQTGNVESPLPKRHPDAIGGRHGSYQFAGYTLTGSCLVCHVNCLDK